MKKKLTAIVLILSLVASLFAASVISGSAIELQTPVITGTESEANGNIIIRWSAVPNAAKYRVLYKNSSGNWVGIGDTTLTEFTGKGAKSGHTYTYSIRCITADGKAFTSSFDTKGWSHKYVDTPVIKTLTPEYNSIRINWGSVTGAQKYRVFYMGTNNEWIKLGDTTSTSVVGRNPKTGTAYTYTVRAISANGEKYESGINDGKTIIYNAASKAVVTVVGGQIDLTSQLVSPVAGKKISWASTNRNVYVTSSGMLTGENENTSAIVTASASDGSKMFFSVRVKSFKEAIVGVTCMVSGRRVGGTSSYSSASTEVYLYKTKTDNSGTGYGKIPNGTKLPVHEYYSTGSPATSRFRVTYNGHTGWVKENYALVNAKELTPSYIVSLSFSDNRSYSWRYGNATPTTNTVYNMFNYKGSRNYIKGISDTNYYKSNTAWLRFDFAKKLAKEQARLLREGYGLKIYDAYRPHSVTANIDAAWDKYIAQYHLTDKSVYGSSLTNQIASPSYVSRHNIGAAVDATLVKNGKEIPMPTIMHDLSWNGEYERWCRGTSEGAKNAQYLYKAMTYGGFGTYSGEWWHFEDNSIAESDRVVYAAGV